MNCNIKIYIYLLFDHSLDENSISLDENGYSLNDNISVINSK